MMDFDSSLLELRTIFLRKITDRYVYFEQAEGESPVGKAVTLRGESVRRLQIPEDVSGHYLATYNIREFRKGKKADLLVYNGVILRLDLEPSVRFRRVLAAEAGIDASQVRTPACALYEGVHDQSLFQRALNLLAQRKVTTQGRWMVNGAEIMFVPDMTAIAGSDVARFVRSQLTSDGAFSLQLAVGFNLHDKSHGAHRVCTPKEGVSLVMHVQDPHTGADIEAVSPMLMRRERSDLFQTGVEESQSLVTIWNMAQDEGQNYAPNLQGVMHLARNIASLYGQERVDWLDVPQLIEQTGKMNLMSIPHRERRKIAVKHLNVLDLVAWLMGQIHREERLSWQMKLSRVMRGYLRTGVMPLERTGVVYREGVEGPEDIPKQTLRVGGDQPAPVPEPKGAPQESEAAA